MLCFDYGSNSELREVIALFVDCENSAGSDWALHLFSFKSAPAGA